MTHWERKKAFGDARVVPDRTPDGEPQRFYLEALADALGVPASLAEVA